ncbi:uncharacterized protein LOC132631872 [Lycium barbarum]|uniref:uncharacterized protein LOC132631872 n=1 Tax=Lycium barbarum TaxID=112863 RepID=UPI00293EFF04|nr:uncharacterized protein LOC132631872 [Lycium barbarum]
MCSSKKQAGVVDISPQTPSHINGRPVFQPYSNRDPLLARHNSHKKSTNFKISSPSSTTNNNSAAKVKNSVLTTPPISPKIKSPRQQTSSEKIVTPKKSPSFKISTPPVSPKIKSPRQQTSSEKILTPKKSPSFKISTPPVSPKIKSPRQQTSSEKILTPKKSPNLQISTPLASPKIKSPRQQVIKKVNTSCEKIVTTKKGNTDSTILVKDSCKKDSSFMILEVAGSIAAARREQVANMQVQRKKKIAHYGRTNSVKLVTPLDSSNNSSFKEGKRCSFITPNSDPVYIAYHDEEWGVPVHDDNLLFELLVLTVAQVGSDWTSVLKKRQDFRDAFSGFDPEIVAKYNEKKINSTSTEYSIEMSQVRGVVDNSKRILEIKKQFGSFQKYLWGFVSNKPIATQYKACNKIPVKTSKSEAMSKDMVKRGFRYVGPTVIHSFMQAVGLTNDHLLTCPRHVQCAALATHPPIAL